MGKVSSYRQTIQDILTAHSQIQPVYGEIEMQTLFDPVRDSPQERLCQRYQVLRAGWLQKKRVYGVLIQIDLKGETIWIQYDGKEVGVANELVERGIPKQDIVLAYHSPFIRQYDGFAVG
jgi:hypothetical protein